MEKLSDTAKPAITAFAFDTAEKLEQFIVDCTDNLENKNKHLEALILSFRHKLDVLDSTKDEFTLSFLRHMLQMYEEHFGIQKIEE